MSTAEEIRFRLVKTTSFLEPYMPLIGAHMVNFLTDSLYDRHVPARFQDEIGRLRRAGEESVMEVFIRHCNGQCVDEGTEIGKFLNSILDLHTANRSVDYYSLDAFRNLLYEEGCGRQDVVPFKGFMSEKKCHEVTLMSPLVAELCESTSSQAVVDIGDGKGYLSSFLALEYGMKVLGVDSSTVKTQGAAKRNKKLNKIWKGTRKHFSANEKEIVQAETKPNTVADYRRVTQFVDVSTDVCSIVSRELGKEVSRVGLVGLHTCGDLAPASLRLFVNNPYTLFVVSVGCCYNLLTEDGCSEAGFPLSKFLRDSHFKLGRNARMVSLKPKRKIGSEEDFGSKSLAYRAVLQELLLSEMKLEPAKMDLSVGRIAAKCSSFVQYMRTALDKLKLDCKMTDEEIQSYYEEKSGKLEHLPVHLMLLTCLSSVVEDLILLDRLLFLKEQGVERSYLVEIFDPAVSPRCYGVVALRS